MSSGLERRLRWEAERQLPPLPVSRVSEHIEEDLAYRYDFTVMRSKDIARRLADGVTDLHQENAARRGDNPVLEQYHNRIEATFVVAGCEGLAAYMGHLER